MVGDEHGSSRSTLAVLRDITKREHAEEVLRQSEELFRVALNESPIVVNQDKDLSFTWVYNPHPPFSAEALIGKTGADALTSHLDT